MGILSKIFKKRNKENKPKDLITKLELNEADKQLIKDFSSYDDDWRVKEIIILAETQDFLYVRLIQYAILYDPNINVKFAALKRIHLFKDHPDVRPMLLEMKDNKIGDKMEPYFSMALSRLGLITVEDFKRKVNGG
jgi:hypothetical protein